MTGRAGPDLPPLRIQRNDSAPEQKTVVYIQANNELGGSDASLFELVRGLDRERYLPHVVLPYVGPFSSRYHAIGVTVHYVPLKKLKYTNDPRWHISYLFKAPLRIWRIARLLQRIKPDIVHLNTSVEILGGAAARRYCTKHGARLVWHVREMDLRIRIVERAIFGLVRRWADTILTISSPLGRLFSDHSSVRVIPNGIDMSRFKPHSRPSCNPAPTIGWVGRVVPWKGLDNLIEAFEQIQIELPTARFLLQTSTPTEHTRYASQLQARIAASPIATALEWRDATDTPEQAYAMMDLFMHLPVLREPLGRTLIEAQATGVPVVTWPHGGIADTIVDGETGCLVPVGDVAAAAHASVELLTDSQQHAAMRRAASRHAHNRFDVASYSSAVQRAYEEVLLS